MRKKRKRVLFAIAMAFAAVIVLQRRCWAQNHPPPAGAILDLNGTPIPGGGNGTTYQQYMVDFTATFTSTAITFAFRDDPADILFKEASVTDLTTHSGNLLFNGNFTGGVYTDNGNAFTPGRLVLCQSVWYHVRGSSISRLRSRPIGKRHLLF